MDRMKSARWKAPRGLWVLVPAMLIVCMATARPVPSQTTPPLELRGVVNEPVVITMPGSALKSTAAGTTVYRARVSESPSGPAPAIESAEQGVIVTCYVPGVYLLQLVAVAREQTSCSAGSETVLEELGIKLTVSP
jgi:hypothetical protein